MDAAQQDGREGTLESLPQEILLDIFLRLMATGACVSLSGSTSRYIRHLWKTTVRRLTIRTSLTPTQIVTIATTYTGVQHLCLTTEDAPYAILLLGALLKDLVSFEYNTSLQLRQPCNQHQQQCVRAPLLSIIHSLSHDMGLRLRLATLRIVDADADLSAADILCISELAGLTTLQISVSTFVKMMTFQEAQQMGKAHACLGVNSAHVYFGGERSDFYGKLMQVPVPFSQLQHLKLETVHPIQQHVMDLFRGNFKNLVSMHITCLSQTFTEAISPWWRLDNLREFTCNYVLPQWYVDQRSCLDIFPNIRRLRCSGVHEDASKIYMPAALTALEVLEVPSGSFCAGPLMRLPSLRKIQARSIGPHDAEEVASEDGEEDEDEEEDEEEELRAQMARWSEPGAALVDCMVEELDLMSMRSNHNLAILPRLPRLKILRCQDDKCDDDCWFSSMEEDRYLQLTRGLEIHADQLEVIDLCFREPLGDHLPANLPACTELRLSADADTLRRLSSACALPMLETLVVYVLRTDVFGVEDLLSCLLLLWGGGRSEAAAGGGCQQERQQEQQQEQQQERRHKRLVLAALDNEYDWETDADAAMPVLESMGKAVGAELPLTCGSVDVIIVRQAVRDCWVLEEVVNRVRV